jgi:hypothetical protein
MNFKRRLIRRHGRRWTNNNFEAIQYARRKQARKLKRKKPK